MSPSFTPTAKLPRFENSRNVEMIGANLSPQRTPRSSIHPFDPSLFRRLRGKTVIRLAFGMATYRSGEKTGWT
jgi:hypothetical protein